MSYIDNNLSSGETVLYRTRLHWIAMVSHFITAFVVALAGAGLLFASFSKIHDKSGDSGRLAMLGVLLLIAATVIVVLAFWKRSATEMAVTNKRVLIKVGLLSRRGCPTQKLCIHGVCT